MWGPLRNAVVCIVWVAAASCGSSTSDPTPMGTPNQAPTASFTASTAAGPAPLEVTFDASASADPDGTIASYAWTFGDGTTGTGITVTHSYAEPGSYTPSLTVTDARGATGSATGTRITVSSPTGTGQNKITGVVWHDANADGQRNEGEDAIPDMVVFLDADGDGTRDAGEATTITADDGTYVFEGLDPNVTYRVTQQLTVGWTNTVPGVASSTGVTGTAPAPSGPARIIGGSVAAQGEFPFQVGLVTADTHFQFCGGTFIAAKWVVTASHCVDGSLDVSTVKVAAGAADLRTGVQYLDIARVIVHPAFSSTAFVENDIALVELVQSTSYPRVELLTPDRAALAAPGVQATVIGWGRTAISAGTGSPVLKKLSAAIISNSTCATQLGSNILDVTICAGMAGANASVCNGDSGGPLLVPFRSRWIQVGIVSFGANICYQPTAFARVSALVGFVTTHVVPEASGAVVVDWGGGVTEARADFGNYR